MKLINQIKSLLNNNSKAFLTYFFSGIFQKLIALFFLPFFTNILSPSDFGEVSIYLSTSSLFLVFSTLNIHYGGINKGIVNYWNKRYGYLSSLIFLSILSSLFTTVMLIVLISLNVLKIPFYFVIFLFFESVFIVSFGLYQNLKRYENKYISLSLTIVVFSFLSFLTPYLFLVVFSNDRVFYRLLGFIAIEIIFGSISMIYLFIKGKKLISIEYWTFTLKLSISLIPHYLAIFILMSADKLLIDNFYTSSEVGIYSFAYTLASSVTLISSAVMSSFTPWLMKNLSRYNHLFKKIFQISNLVILIFFMSSIVVINLLQIFVYFFTNKEYNSSLSLIPFIVYGYYFNFIASIFSIFFMYEKKTLIISLGTLLSAFINITLNLIFLPIFGIITASFSTFLTYLILFLFYLLFLKDKIKLFNFSSIILYTITLGFFSIYHTIFSISIVSVIMTFLIILVFLFPLTRMSFNLFRNS
jgi:O-antigen/teichoic acid export membrane protein